MTKAETTHALRLIEYELSAVTGALTDRRNEIDRLVEILSTAKRIFVTGQGRSGLALRMMGMRLMHLGLTVHIVGDTTTPAIRADDVLLAASGSGTTAGVVRAAGGAVATGARVAAITTDPGSPLAGLSAASIIVPAAGKLDRSGAASAQYAGSLFEQAVLVIGDAIFHSLWVRSGATADELWPRHANLE
jgi:6-phospho-3-hexuloisomerase